MGLIKTPEVTDWLLICVCAFWAILNNEIMTYMYECNFCVLKPFEAIDCCIALILIWKSMMLWIVVKPCRYVLSLLWFLWCMSLLMCLSMNFCKPFLDLFPKCHKISEKPKAKKSKNQKIKIGQDDGWVMTKWGCVRTVYEL